MKLLSLVATILISCNLTWSQEIEFGPEEQLEELSGFKDTDQNAIGIVQIDCLLQFGVEPPRILDTNFDLPSKHAEDIAPYVNRAKTAPVNTSFPKAMEDIPFKPVEASDVPISPPKKQYTGSDRFHWKPALAESLYFLGIQHGFRLMQRKTRREIKGPFFADWGTSVKNLGRWRDGDSFLTNYVAHPMQGALTGRIFINNSPRSRKQNFGKSKEYWKSRFKAMAWSAVWSTQFELGPISEASIGNVGLFDKSGPNRMGWVDLVVTPTAGTGVLIGEDIIDKFVLKKWLERKIRSRTRVKIYRTFFTPFQSFSNILRGKAPWRRDSR